LDSIIARRDRDFVMLLSLLLMIVVKESGAMSIDLWLE
jgi:hypothetical protein